MAKLRETEQKKIQEAVEANKKGPCEAVVSAIVSAIGIALMVVGGLTALCFLLASPLWGWVILFGLAVPWIPRLFSHKQTE